MKKSFSDLIFHDARTDQSSAQAHLADRLQRHASLSGRECNEEIQESAEQRSQTDRRESAEK